MEDLGIPIRATVLDSFLEQHVNHKSSTYWSRSPFVKRAVSRLNPQAETFSPKTLELDNKVGPKRLDFTSVASEALDFMHTETSEVEEFKPSFAMLDPEIEEYKPAPKFDVQTTEFVPSFGCVS